MGEVEMRKLFKPHNLIIALQHNLVILQKKCHWSGVANLPRGIEGLCSVFGNSTELFFKR